MGPREGCTGPWLCSSLVQPPAQGVAGPTRLPNATGINPHSQFALSPLELPQCPHTNLTNCIYFCVHRNVKMWGVCLRFFSLSSFLPCLPSLLLTSLPPSLPVFFSPAFPPHFLLFFFPSGGEGGEENGQEEKAQTLSCR